MPVRIRLARLGCRHDPHYRIGVANSWAKRDGKCIEALGMYHPKPDSDGVKRLTLNFNRTKYWLSVGAQPTETVARILGKAGIMPSIPRGPIKANESLQFPPNNIVGETVKSQ